MANKKKEVISAEEREVLDLMAKLNAGLIKMWLFQGKEREALYCAAYAKALMDALFNSMAQEVSDGK